MATHVRASDASLAGMAHGAEAGFEIRGQSVGITVTNPVQVIKAIRKGLPYSSIVKLEKESGFSVERIAESIQLPVRTLARRKKEGRLSSAESERLLRLGMVFEKALALFNSNPAAAQQWLSTPAKALGGIAPLEMIQTEIGAREVEDLIGRLEHGVFS